MKLRAVLLALLCVASPVPAKAPTGDSEPLPAGVGGVSNPRLLEASKVAPDYPELAHLARLEADVILQAVIREDGSVGEIEVLNCSRPQLGFEDAAVAAVRQWRYEPATREGRPVDVFFTIFVQFRLEPGGNGDVGYVNDALNYRIDDPGSDWMPRPADAAPVEADFYYRRLDREAFFIGRAVPTGMAAGEVSSDILSDFILHHLRNAANGFDVLVKEERVVNGLPGVLIVVGIPAGGPDLIQVTWAYAKNGRAYLLVFVTDGAGDDIDTMIDVAVDGFEHFSLIDPDRPPPTAEPSRP